MNIKDLISNLDTIEHTTGNPVNALDSLDITAVEPDLTDRTEVSVMTPPVIANGQEDSACGCEEQAPDYEEEDTDGQLGDIARLAGLPQLIVIQ